MKVTGAASPPDKLKGVIKMTAQEIGRKIAQLRTKQLRATDNISRYIKLGNEIKALEAELKKVEGETK